MHNSNNDNKNNNNNNNDNNNNYYYCFDDDDVWPSNDHRISQKVSSTNFSHVLVPISNSDSINAHFMLAKLDN